MITLANGKQYETVAIYGATETFQCAPRKTLKFIIRETDITYDEIYAMYTDPSILSEVKVESDGQTSVHLNYTLPMDLKLSLFNEESCYQLHMAQLSQSEIQQAQLLQDNVDIQMALIELAETVTTTEE